MSNCTEFPETAKLISRNIRICKDFVFLVHVAEDAVVQSSVLLACPLFLKLATPSKIVGTQRVAVTKANTTCGHAFGWGNGAQALMKRMSVCHMPLLCSLYLFDITKTVHSQLQMYSLCGYCKQLDSMGCRCNCISLDYHHQECSWHCSKGKTKTNVIHTLKLPSWSGEQPCTITGMTGEYAERKFKL